jgi:hypothetical protein
VVAESAHRLKSKGKVLSSHWSALLRMVLRSTKFSKAETGFQGVLNYIRSSGTPFERMIAKAVSEVFKNTKNPPKVVFTEGKSQFDPKKNTVTMSPTASPEVALHEALHAALQWFVHSFPKDPTVLRLIKSVNQVVKYDTTKLSDKAAEVQKVLADLVAGKRDLDAVLELISYGNTLVEFRKALEAMPSKGTPPIVCSGCKRCLEHDSGNCAPHVGCQRLSR